ncbi:MAG: hypothetical protein ACQKBY_00670 [Verrucomicrobiales bacterium]
MKQFEPSQTEMKGQDFSKLQELLRLKRYEEPRDDYFVRFVDEARSRRLSAAREKAVAPSFFARLGAMKWLLGAGVGSAYAGVMLGMLLMTDTGEENGVTVQPASAEFDFSPVPVREVDFKAGSEVLVGTGPGLEF